MFGKCDYFKQKYKKTPILAIILIKILQKSNSNLKIHVSKNILDRKNSKKGEKRTLITVIVGLSNIPRDQPLRPTASEVKFPGNVRLSYDNLYVNLTTTKPP